MSYQSRYAVRSKAVIYRSELEYISKCVLDYPQIETGGDLFGFWTYSGYPVIQYVIGPGKKANHKIAFFNQDVEYLSYVGDALRSTHGLQHIGEWHSHHCMGLAEPSGHDVSTVVRAIDNYNLGKFFLVITNIDESTVGINGFMFKKEQGRMYDHTGWVVLDGESPIRADFDKSHSELVIRPATQKATIGHLINTYLDSEVYIKPEYKQNYWLNNKGNHLALKKIIDDLGKEFVDVKAFQNETDKLVYISFIFDEMLFMLLFPNDFPYERPSLLDAAGNAMETNVEWPVNGDFSESTITYTIKCINALKSNTETVKHNPNPAI